MPARQNDALRRLVRANELHVDALLTVQAARRDQRTVTWQHSVATEDGTSPRACPIWLVRGGTLVEE
jgi:hypothetical protein